MDERPLFKKYIKEKLNIWQQIFLCGDIGFTAKKLNIKHINWFLKKKYLRKNIKRGEVYYYPHKKSAVVTNFLKMSEMIYRDETRSGENA